MFIDWEIGEKVVLKSQLDYILKGDEPDILAIDGFRVSSTDNVKVFFKSVTNYCYEYELIKLSDLVHELHKLVWAYSDNIEKVKKIIEKEEE